MAGSSTSQKAKAVDDVTVSNAASFPVDPTSANAARHFARNFLNRMKLQDDVIDSVELVISELVTNSVLHAGTGPTVRIAVSTEQVRLEVRDASTTSPVLSHFGGSAATGRGLSVVSRVAQGWGVDTDQYGKTVWADFDRRYELPFPTDQTPIVTSERNDEKWSPGLTRTIQLNGVPISLYLELEEHDQGSLREFELLAIVTDPEALNVAPSDQQLAALIVQANSYFGAARGKLHAAVQRAIRRHSKYGNFKLLIDSDAISYAHEYCTLMGRADALCDEGVLLTAPLSLDARRLREWVAQQLADQYLDPSRVVSFDA